MGTLSPLKGHWGGFTVIQIPGSRDPNHGKTPPRVSKVGGGEENPPVPPGPPSQARIPVKIRENSRWGRGRPVTRGMTWKYPRTPGYTPQYCFASWLYMAPWWNHV